VKAPTQALDPVTLEVIRNRLDAIADEMEVVLLRSAFSSIVKEGLDASAAVFDARGQTVAQAVAIPIHLGALAYAVEAIVARFPPSTMQPGDVFILNDPYSGGTHLPDIVILVPVVFEGRVLALCATMCHHQEIGGKTPGSLPPDATELYQEGLVIPPMYLARQGVRDETLYALIAHNVRIPTVVLGDLAAQIAACHVGCRRLEDLARQYGVSQLTRALELLQDRAEQLTRAAIDAIPDGTYAFEDYLDNDGITLDTPVKICARITVAGNELTVDFTGSSPQVRGPFNCVPASTLSAVYYVVRAVTDPTIPSNAGCFRPVRAILPPGTVVNASRPAPVNSRTATVKRIADVLMGAMVQALPQRLPAANSGQLLVMAMGGVDPLTGQPYVTTELGAGGMGARPHKDGVDAIETDVSNCMNIPAEALELEHPVRVVHWRLRPGSGGAGRFRGGLGMDKGFQLLRGEATVTYRGERHRFVPWGLFGGRPGLPSRAAVHRRDGRVDALPSKATLHLREGDMLVVETPGGGGYGDPLERSPEAVLDDVRNHRLSVAAAREEYGVVIKDCQVDKAETHALRQAMRAQRGPITWTFDFGPERPRQ
jgi:N-methylhydantoinase B